MIAPSSSLPRRTLLTLVVAWTMLCGAGFMTLFSFPETDDVAGFVFAVLALQVPAFLALGSARDGEELSAARSVAVAIPAAIVGAFAAFFVFGSVAAAFFHDFGDLTAVFLAFGASLLGCVGSGLVVGLYLPRRPHPLGARRVLTWFAIASLVGGVVVMVVARRREAALGVVMAMPLAWCVPLLLVTRRSPVEPVPVARVR
jgi:hypothetical protein